MYDIIIIGGGVVGLSIARELSRKQVKTAVLEKNADIGEGASKANSGIVHAGFDTRPGTLKARLNLRGSKIMPALSKELDFAYKNNGAMVLCFSDEEKPALEELLDRGKKNGVDGLVILNQEELRHKEPTVNEKAKYALYAPTGAIVCPFGLTQAMAENAVANGVDIYRNTEVINISKSNGIYEIRANQYNVQSTEEEHFSAKVIINAAGVFADHIHKMVSSIPLKITPRKGEYLLFDKSCHNLVSHTLFQLPTPYGKGVLITPTTHQNLLLGPTAEDILDKDGINTTAPGIDVILKKAANSIKEIPVNEIITSFAGLRANPGQYDFIIAEAKDSPGFIDVAGIDSPGLSSAPAIGEYVAALVDRIFPAASKTDFIEARQGIKPGRGEVICRCEIVCRSEIIEAIQRCNGLFKNSGIVSLDSVKRRVRSGMGRCQAGFCSPRVAELIASELNIDKINVFKEGYDSRILCERV